METHENRVLKSKITASVKPTITTLKKITNKELINLLLEYPMDAECSIDFVKYDKDTNYIILN